MSGVSTSFAVIISTSQLSLVLQETDEYDADDLVVGKYACGTTSRRSSLSGRVSNKEVRGDNDCCMTPPDPRKLGQVVSEQNTNGL